MTQIGRRKFLTEASLTAGAALVPTGTAVAVEQGRAAPPGRPGSSHPPAAALARHDTPGDRDFPTVGGNLGNQNYTGLGGIHRGNVKHLKGAWYNRIEGGLESGNSQSTAVAVDGVLYIESAPGNVFAVDGKTGETKWKYEQTGGSLTRRGVAVGDGKVYTLGRTNRVIALDKDTGEVVWDRQHNGYGNIQKVGVIFHSGKLFVGTNDGGRGAALCFDATTGDLLWHFWGAPGPGEFGNETWEGNSWQNGGATPWVHPAVDPELGMVYWTFGNARGNRSSQDGTQRGGMNLFANSIVALDLETGEYRWHFQSVHHDIWDMDNAMNPVLVDVKIKGQDRKLVVYGSKSNMYFILDRTDGSAPLGIDELPVAQDERHEKTWPTQPFPRQGPWAETSLVHQPLGTSIPGHPARAVPNFETGDIYTAHWDEPVLSIPGHGGGADWNHQSFSQSTGLMYTGYGNVCSAHSLHESSNGLRPPGIYMTGGIVAVDPRQNKVRWRKLMPYSLAHGNGILTTASDLLFIGQPDGNLLCLDARNGREIWRFQCGAAISSSPIMYEVDGEQYLAVYAGGTSIPYGNSAPRGDWLWAFKIGGTIDEVPAPPPPEIRRPVANDTPVEGSTVDNTVVLARTFNHNNGTVSSQESNAPGAMAPTHLRVPVGTTVKFVNPADNTMRHGATQYFEGLFDFLIEPGEVFEYTFTKKGEYFYNNPGGDRPGRSAGKIVVY